MRLATLARFLLYFTAVGLYVICFAAPNKQDYRMTLWCIVPLSGPGHERGGNFYATSSPGISHCTVNLTSDIECAGPAEFELRPLQSAEESQSRRRRRL